MDLSERIFEGLMTLAPKAREAVENACRETVTSSSPQLVVTFVTPSGRRLEPEVSFAYMKALWSFATSDTYENEALDSAVTERVVNATVSALSDLLASKAAQQAIAQSLGSRDVVGATNELLSDELAQMAREAFDSAGVSPRAMLSGYVIDTAQHQAGQFFASAAGQAVLAALAKAMVTTAGKVFIVKVVQLAVLKIGGSIALKSALAAIVKKIGVGVIAKSVLVKVLVLAIPALASVKIPIFWIVAPLIVGFLAYEISRLPTKLGNELPPAVGNKIAESFPEIARQMADAILMEATRRAAMATSH